MIMSPQEIPYWFQVFYIIVSPFFVAIGTVSMFALAMALSWSKASATMFTSYMALANLSVVIGNKLIEPFDFKIRYWGGIRSYDDCLLVASCFS